jgi:decaprenylphospho-beta-D-erythro-pentofuranosid-2-ulose 2-reductase
MSTLILGANSDIAKEIALLLNEKENLILASRDTTSLSTYINDNNIKGEVVLFDATDIDSHKAFFQNHQNIDSVICAFGILGNHEKAIQNFSEASKIINTNYVGAVSILDLYASYFENRKSGLIVGISSVAADRGRKSNYYYGSAKAGFEAYLSGLRNRLYDSKVHVMTVKPGFVKTKMITGMKTPGFLTSTPEKVAKRIIKTSKNKRNIIYISWKWYWVMGIIKNIPEFIFKKLNL